jgi:radical SAM-linked protein
MADIKLTRDMPAEDILARLHKATVDDLDFFACYPAERKFADIDGALYEYNIECDVDDEMLEKIDRVLSNSPLTVLKHTKSGDKEVDIFPLIKSFKLEKLEGGLKITALLAAGSNQNLSPEYLLEALRKRLIFLREEENYSIKRLSIHDAKGNIFK